MAAFTLESLVLRGFAVPSDGTVGLRRETGVAAYRETPEVRPSMRHPSLGWLQGFTKPCQRPDHAVQNCVDAAAIGAGRSRSRVGVLRRRSARLAGKAIG
jgi:hypothetical protein